MYIVINLGLFLLNFFTSRGEWWFFWPLMGWGISLIFHALGVFVFSRFPGKQWEDRKIKELMDQDKENK